MTSTNEKTKLKKDFSPPAEDDISGNSEIDINTAMENASFGCGTILYCIGPFLFFCLEGAEIVVLSIVGLMVKCEWGLTTFWVSALQMIVIFGMLLSSVLFSSFGDKFGRKPICLLCVIGLTVAGILCRFVDSFWQLFLLRSLVGVFVGMGSPPAVALCGEIPPKRFRALSLSGICLAWGVGASITSGIAYFVVEPYGWRGLLLATALAFSPCILCFALIRESPRHDVQKGKFEEAEKTIKIIYKLNCKPAAGLKLKRDAVVVEECTEECTEDASILKTLKETGNVTNCVVLCILGACAVYAYYAVSYTVPRFLNEGYCSDTVVTSLQSCTFDKSVLFDLGVVSLSEPLGVLVAAIMVDIIGRRKTFFSAVVLSLGVTTALYFCVGYHYMMVMLTLTRMGVAAVAWAPYILVAEYFPTSVRSFTLSLFFACSRVAAIVAIYCAQYAYNASPRLLIACVQVPLAVTGALLVLLKKETMGVELS